MPFPFLALGAGAATAGLNIAANLSNRRERVEFPGSTDEINEFFDLQLNQGESQIRDRVSRDLSGRGFGGSTISASLVEDMISNFRTNLEQVRSQRLREFEFAKAQFDAMQPQNPSTLASIASGIGSGVQTGLSVFGLQGGFDQSIGFNQPQQPQQIDSNTSSIPNFNISNPVSSINDGFGFGNQRTFMVQ